MASSMIILATIWHTGTQYAMHNLVPQARQIHCNHPALWPEIEAHDGDVQLHTTFRDPYLVAASWGNQYPRLDEVASEWFGQWDDWAKIMDMGATAHLVSEFAEARIGSKPDRKNLHRYLAQKNMSAFHDIIPHRWTDYAMQIVRNLAYE